MLSLLPPHFNVVPAATSLSLSFPISPPYGCSEIHLPLVIDVGVCGATLDDPVILFDERAECFKPHYNSKFIFRGLSQW